jgi:hypothetical protein
MRSAVARHDDGDVEVARGLHQVDHELDVEVGLTLLVAVLADVLLTTLYWLRRGTGGSCAGFVRRARYGIRADEIASGGGRLQQRDVVDVHAGRLGRVEDVRHVYEDGDVLAHSDLWWWGGPAFPAAQGARFGGR